ncbi:MAG: zeta toxin family protein [Bacteroidales bacterium]|nr:zeta toxin family protein [Bacteroidales bacterium]
MPSLYIISGCNGAGKTTASYTLLPDLLNCDEYVNSDEIAKGLSPFNPSLAAIKASKLMTERIHELLEKRATFGIETTLATRSLARVITGAQAIGYRVTLVFFWLQVPELAIQRVKLRVASGGHSVPEETIIRRYGAGIDNLFRIYTPIVDYWMIIDNSNTPSKLVAEGGLSVVTKLHDKTAYNQLLNYERAREQGFKG